MPTYQEELVRIESEISTAIDNQQTHTVFEKCFEKFEILYELGTEYLQAMSFQQAADTFVEVNNLYQKIEEYRLELEQAGTLQKDDADYKGIFTDLAEFDAMCSGFYFFSTAQVNNQSRNPGIAAAYFAKSNVAFTEAFTIGNKAFLGIFAKYSTSLQIFSEGLEDYYRANFSSAKSKCQRSYIILQELIDNDLNKIADPSSSDFQNKDIINKFKADYQTIKSYYYICDARYQFNNRNFKNASNQFTHVAQEMNVTIENYKESLPEGIKFLLMGEYHNYSGWKSLSDAEMARERADWNSAFTNYEDVRKKWEVSSGFYLQSKLPQALALQEYILNQSLNIDVYQSQCDNERELNEKVERLENQIKDLQDRISNAIKPTGVIVNNTNEVVTTVENNVKFIQTMEINAKESIKEILAALKDSNLDEATKKQIEKDGSDILKSDEKGLSFFDKIKKFTKDTAEVVKNIGEIAGPIGIAVKALALLF